MIRKTYWLIVITGLFMMVLSAGRFYFLIRHQALFAGLPFDAVFMALVRGLRFDLAATAMVTAPFFAFLFLPVAGRIKVVAKSILILLLVWLAVVTLFTAIDVEYFSFAQRHSSFEVLTAWGDAGTVFGIALRTYAPQLAGTIVLIIIISALFWRLALAPRWLWNRPVTRGIYPVLGDVVFMAVVAALVVIAGRGGLQMKPMGVRNAFADERVELGMLTLNGVYTAVHTIGNQLDHGKGKVAMQSLHHLLEGVPANHEAVKELIVAADREETYPDYPLYRRFRYPDTARRPMNVVLLVMESWSAKFTGALGGVPSGTPWFDSIAGEGLLMTNCFANAQRSIEGLAAIMGSMPVAGYGEIPYQTRFVPVGQVLKSLGYTTMFIHGAKRGTMGFDALVNRIGIEKSLWRQDFKDLPPDRFGLWGAYDEDVFMRANAEFAACRQPFFGVVYTLASHTPYDIPPGFQRPFAMDVPQQAFLNALAYSDFALKRFFEQARQSPYFTNTLFVIVGDHTEGQSTGGSLYEGYRIPAWFFGPGLVTPGTVGAVTSQLDVIPSIYDMLKINSWFTACGRSVLAPGQRRALLPRGDLFVWVHDPHMLLADLKTPLSVYDWRTSPAKAIDATGDGPALAGALFDEMRIYLQFTYGPIMENRLMPPVAP